MNSFGNIFRITTFGESHGEAIGGVIDGMPAGINVDMDFIQNELSRRSPGHSSVSSHRREEDRVEIISGVFEGKTTGCPIGFIVRNTDHHSQDYEPLRCLFRPSHADFTYQQKYGVRDYRGGGRSSARITVSRCVAGAFAKLVLKSYGISIQAFTSAIGNVSIQRDYTQYDLSTADTNSVKCPDSVVAETMKTLIEDVKKDGDSIGGVVTCVIKGCPVGLGEPEFDKLQAVLAHAMLSINAAKGFEYGDGFEAAEQRGSQQNDAFCTDEDGRITTQTNHSGGIQGGITNGQDIYFRVAFKPTPTIGKTQQTVDVEGNAVTLNAKGRHDPCVVPRAVPIVEAMAAITVLDMLLLRKAVQP